MADDNIIKLVHIPPKAVQVSHNMVWNFKTEADALAFIACVKQTGQMAACKGNHHYTDWREASSDERFSFGAN